MPYVTRHTIIPPLLIALASCASFSPSANQATVIQNAAPTQLTDTSRALTSLPPPKGRITVSVYNIKDQTGQYKPSPSNGFSTAVMQGATAVLVKALIDSKWFIPLEREGLQNLLTERKIIRAHKGVKDLEELAAASLIIEGSIIAYDTNVRTGGGWRSISRYWWIETVP